MFTKISPYPCEHIEIIKHILCRINTDINITYVCMNVFIGVCITKNKNKNKPDDVYKEIRFR